MVWSCFREVVLQLGLYLLRFSNSTRYIFTLYSPCIGVEPLNPEDPRQWSTGALTWFEQHVLEKSFFALKLTKENGRSCITLLDTPMTEKTVDIRDILKKEGFATLQTY